MGPICISALSSGGIIWKSNVFVRPSFVHFGFVHLIGCIGFGFRLGQARMRSIDLPCFVGLRPDREQTNIARYVPISAERRSVLGYQLNDRELVE